MVRTSRWIVGLMIGALAGCGPAQEKLVPVAGKVIVDGKPLGSGQVQYVAYLPEDPERLHYPMATISAAGTYALQTAGRPGAPPGHYKVLVWATDDPGINGNPWSADGKLRPMKWLINAKYTKKDTTDLSIEVVTEPAPGQYDLTLTK